MTPLLFRRASYLQRSEYGSRKQSKGNLVRACSEILHTGPSMQILMTDSSPFHDLIALSSFCPQIHPSPHLHPDLHLHSRQDPGLLVFFSVWYSWIEGRKWRLPYYFSFLSKSFPQQVTSQLVTIKTPSPSHHSKLSLIRLLCEICIIGKHFVQIGSAICNM